MTSSSIYRRRSRWAMAMACSSMTGGGWSSWRPRNRGSTSHITIQVVWGGPPGTSPPGNCRIRIRPDHVIEDMLHGFGATLVKLEAAFQPEGGAYRSHRHGAHGETSDHHEEP